MLCRRPSVSLAGNQKTRNLPITTQIISPFSAHRRGKPERGRAKKSPPPPPKTTTPDHGAASRRLRLRLRGHRQSGQSRTQDVQIRPRRTGEEEGEARGQGRHAEGPPQPPGLLGREHRPDAAYRPAQSRQGPEEGVYPPQRPTGGARRGGGWASRR